MDMTDNCKVYDTDLHMYKHMISNDFVFFKFIRNNL